MSANTGINAYNETKKTRIGAVDNNGEFQLLTPKEWKDHPDTYRLKPNGEKKEITESSIRNLWQKKNAGKADVTNRQLVGLDDYYPWDYSLTTIKKDNRDEYDDDFKYRQGFLRRRLV